MLFSPRRQLEAVIRHEGRHVARCLVRRGRYVIGQDRKNEIVVDEASVSSRHARLTVVSETEIYIEDFGSANGTLINGKPADGLTRLTQDCKVQIGHCSLEFQRSGLPAGVFQHLPEGFLRPQRYNFGDAVVEGSTSTIYQAHDTSLDRDLAIKVMRPQSQASTPNVLRFIREAQITSQLQHPCIPPVYELSVDDQSQLFYTTRFVEGETLDDILNQIAAGHQPTVERYGFGALMAIFQKICDGVAFAHSRGVVHCALRPECIMVGSFGEVFIIGWGFSKVLPAAEVEGGNPLERVRAPASSITPPFTSYTAPEQASGELDRVDFRTDIYSLGGLLYRILTLQDPIPSDDEAELFNLVLAGKIIPLATFANQPRPHWPGGHIPERLAGATMRALNRSQDVRQSSVLQLQRDIASWQETAIQSAEAAKTKKNGAPAHAKL